MTTDRYLAEAARAALDELARELPSERLLRDASDRAEYSRTTLPRGTYPAGIIRPRSLAEVQSIMRVLTKHGARWHAISCGKNWGYGDACAPEDGWIIIELSDLNRVIEVNEELAYAVIEPGVTQGQLYLHLQETHSRLMLDVTGAGPQASIVGNTLQRGFGHTPYGDHFAHSCNYQVVLPDGTLTHTGFGDLPSGIGHVYPYGVGPFNQGVFSQSHAGIVTRMTVWLMPRPECIAGFGFRIQDDRDLPAVIDRLRELRQRDVVRSVIHVANDLRAAARHWNVVESGSTDEPMPHASRLRLRKQLGLGAWNALGGLYGSPRMIRGAQLEVSRAFRGLARVRYFGPRKLTLLRHACSLTGHVQLPVVRRLRRLSETIRSVYDLLSGIPNVDHLEAVRRHGSTPDTNADDLRNHGLVWIAPVLPLIGHEVAVAVRTLTKAANEYGFDLPLTISPVFPSCAVAIGDLTFLRNGSRAENVDLAMKSIAAVQNQHGWHSYRKATPRPDRLG
jgi:4-cresol dehydrogenase (hydroxylating)